jgi:hypothetical protein
VLTAVSGGSELLISVWRAAHSNDLSLSFGPRSAIEGTPWTLVLTARECSSTSSAVGSAAAMEVFPS